MLASRIKEKLRNGEVCLGGWMSLGHFSIGEILAGAGYDWVLVETEHTAIDNSEALRYIAAIEGAGAVPLVRLASIDPVQAKAILDSGAAGLLIPMVNTRADAELAVRSAKYPPLGIRGVGLARAHQYGAKFQEYVEAANRDTLLIVQIEHIDAVNNIDEILSVEGIDGTFIGPYDLSMSLGLPGQLTHPKVQEAKRRVLEATKAAGLAPGIHLLHPDQAVREIKQCVEDGYTFIALGSDLMFLKDMAGQLHSSARELIRKDSI